MQVYNEDPKDHYAEAKASARWHSETFGNWNPIHRRNASLTMRAASMTSGIDCLDDLVMFSTMSRVPAYKNGRTVFPIGKQS